MSDNTILGSVKLSVVCLSTGDDLGEIKNRLAINIVFIIAAFH